MKMNCSRVKEMWLLGVLGWNFKVLGISMEYNQCKEQENPIFLNFQWCRVNKFLNSLQLVNFFRAFQSRMYRDWVIEKFFFILFLSISPSDWKSTRRIVYDQLELNTLGIYFNLEKDFSIGYVVRDALYIFP